MNGKPCALTEAVSLTMFNDEAGPRIEYALRQNLPVTNTAHSLLFEQALNDAVFPGGRRFRAMLALLVSELILSDDADTMAAAVAVEYLHCSTLIFDDLPAMDDAKERRGKPCLHLRYGEGLAVSVALALMNASYRMVTSGSARDFAATQRAFREITECVGVQIAGQAADLTAEEPACHSKTSALIRLALTLGPILSGADPGDIDALRIFGESLGEAYQTADDSRDIDEDTALLNRGRRATFAIEHGPDAARERASALTERAQRDLMARFGDLPAVLRLCQFTNLPD
jgi:geranylgeranyl diphosphate synthase, type II